MISTLLRFAARKVGALEGVATLQMTDLPLAPPTAMEAGAPFIGSNIFSVLLIKTIITHNFSHSIVSFPDALIKDILSI
jgi:hypothetical protein